MPRRPRCLPTLILMLAALLAAFATARAQERRWAAVDLDQVDEDFAFQGEYVGPLRGRTPAGAWGWSQAGLQVIARGHGRFDAVQYPGGLPGAGWTGIEKARLSGERDGDSLLLQGSPLEITVESGTATVRDAAGTHLGVLRKVHRLPLNLGWGPPPGGKVLFDGTGTQHFRRARMTDDGLLVEGATLKEAHRDFTLHVEFRLPYMPHARGQGRANSGVYLQRRYEIQILDTFGLEGETNECGAIYTYRRPDVNMCLPPLSWQTLTIRFTAPRFDADGNKTRNARVKVWHNGVIIHNDVDVPHKTGGGAAEGPEPLPTYLQDHGNPVRFRNVWILDHDRPEVSPPAWPPVIPTVPLAAVPPRPRGTLLPGTPGWPRVAVNPSGIPLGHRPLPHSPSAPAFPNIHPGTHRASWLY